MRRFVSGANWRWLERISRRQVEVQGSMRRRGTLSDRRAGSGGELRASEHREGSAQSSGECSGELARGGASTGVEGSKLQDGARLRL